MESERERIVARVEKLLALASSDNPNESAAAAAAAQRLIERHAISESELGRQRGERPHTDHAPLHTWPIGDEDWWRQLLASAIARGTGCFPFKAHSPSRGVAELRVAGCDSDVVLCRAVFAWCTAEIERLALRISGEPVASIEYQRGVLLGAVQRIAAEIEQERIRTREELEGDVSRRALVVMDRRSEEAEAAVGPIPEGNPIDPWFDPRGQRRGFSEAAGVYARGRRPGIE